jgi:protein-S-isoprenylcysteine O-methyltransferase Ste14
VDGDREAGGLDRSEARGAAAASLAALASLPVVSLLLERLAHAPSWIVAAVATLPLGALLLVAITWRAGGGRS